MTAEYVLGHRKCTNLQYQFFIKKKWSREDREKCYSVDSKEIRFQYFAQAAGTLILEPESLFVSNRDFFLSLFFNSFFGREKRGFVGYQGASALLSVAPVGRASIRYIFI